MVIKDVGWNVLIILKVAAVSGDKAN